ncbi:MAG: MFS transporter [Acidimicrobiia bacterium]
MRRILLGVAAGTTACVLPPFLFGAMAVQMREDLGFSEAGTGLGVGAFFAAGALCSAVLGRRAERVGASKALQAAVLWAAITQLGVAVLARSLSGVLILLGLAGAANAMAQPAANLLISQALPAQRQGLAFAVKQAAIPFSTLVGGLAVPTVALTVGWRWAFVGAAAVSVAAVAAVPPLAPRTIPDTTGAFSAERAPWRTMMMLSAGIALGAAAAGMLGAFLVSAAADAGLEPGAAGLCLTLGSVVGLASRLLAGVRADRRGGGHLRVVAVMLALGSVSYLLLALHRPALYLASVPLAFGAGWAWPGLFNLAVVRANPGSPAAATGITQTGTYRGAVAGPLVFGVVAEHSGFGAAWLLAAAASAAAAAAIWVGRNMLRRSRAAVAGLPPLAGT